MEVKSCANCIHGKRCGGNKYVCTKYFMNERMRKDNFCSNWIGKFDWVKYGYIGVSLTDKCVVNISFEDKKEEEKMKLSDFIKKYGDCEVTEEMEKCIKKKKGKWMPEFGEIYYFVNDSDYVASSNWGDTLTDKYRRNFIGIFKTDDEAYRYREIMKACKEASFEPDWEDRTQLKHYLYYDHKNRRSGVSHINYIHGGDKFFFETSEIAQRLIGRFGEKDIAKYVLGVEVED